MKHRDETGLGVVGVVEGGVGAGVVGAEKRNAEIHVIGRGEFEEKIEFSKKERAEGSAAMICVLRSRFALLSELALLVFVSLLSWDLIARAAERVSLQGGAGGGRGPG